MSFEVIHVYEKCRKIDEWYLGSVSEESWVT